MTAPMPPRDQRYFEDYVVGTVHAAGSVTLGEAEIIAFAEQFDPQPFHIDPVAAASGPFGGLIASGWHTGSSLMRLLVDNYLSSVASLGSPGVDELRFVRPVRPNDTLTLRATILDARPSASKPDRGIVRTLLELFNQHGELVFKVTATNLLLRRPATR